jgi:hypothetical protein
MLADGLQSAPTRLAVVRHAIKVLLMNRHVHVKSRTCNEYGTGGVTEPGWGARPFSKRKVSM